MKNGGGGEEGGGIETWLVIRSRREKMGEIGNPNFRE